MIMVRNFKVHKLNEILITTFNLNLIAKIQRTNLVAVAEQDEVLMMSHRLAFEILLTYKLTICTIINSSH